MNWNDTLRHLDTPLPEDIARLKAAGYCTQAIAAIDRLLAEDWTQTQNGGQSPDKAENCMTQLPESWRAGLLAQREILTRIPGEYPCNEAEALAHIQSRIPDMTQEQFRALVADNRIDWRFVDGEPHFARRFVETLIYTDDNFALRAGVRPDYASRVRRGEQAVALQQKGTQSAKIRLKFSMKASDEAFARAMEQAKKEGRTSVRAKLWLPAPAACPSQSEIQLESFWREPTSIAPETAPQRTIYWETELTENTPVEAVVSYVRTAQYVDPMSLQDLSNVTDGGFAPENYLGEQLPHVRFTPAMRALTAAVIGDAEDDAEKVSRIYDYVTLNVKYRFMPQYFILESIAENCAHSRRGDCGVQALTFITMCRIAGIPAMWESGLSVEPQEAGCHDWAMFWLEGKGWLYADCSFGGSAACRGEEALRRHYFGSLDTGRFAANHAFQAPLTPPKESWRADPYDNQTGEMELEGVGLKGREYQTNMTTLAYELL